jgi:hypothetical protein
MQVGYITIVVYYKGLEFTVVMKKNLWYHDSVALYATRVRRRVSRLATNLLTRILRNSLSALTDALVTA